MYIKKQCYAPRLRDVWQCGGKSNIIVRQSQILQVIKFDQIRVIV